MTGRARFRGGRLLGAVFLALAGGFACRREASGPVARLRLPESESLTIGPETRPGVWLSPGDAIEWELSAGPPVRVGGSYSGTLMGPSAGKLRLEMLSASRKGRAVHSSSVALSADTSGWRTWSGVIPEREKPSTLRLAWDNGEVPAAAHSIFLTEPSLSTGQGPPGRTVVLFLVDTLRADHVSGYGYRLPTTPHLDRYFDGWLRAETCLPSANWTLPSHASLFTSVSVARHRVGRYGHVLPEGLPTLSESLARAGFRTLAVVGGGYVDPSFGFARGFDRYAVVPGPARKAVATALAMLEETSGEPAFLFLHTYQVHDFAPDEDVARRLFPDPGVLGPHFPEDVGKLRANGAMADPRFPLWIRSRYDAALASVDAAFGSLLEGLGRQGRLERTAILFTSDHGEGLCDRVYRGQCLQWGHGSPYLYEEELRVPLEARIPWRPEARGIVGGNASLLDVAPTLLAAVGASVPASFEGRSLLSGAAAPDRVVVTEAPPLDALTLRKARSKLVRRTGGAPRSVFDPGTFYYALPAEECYDLALDPMERRRLPCRRGLEDQADRYVASGFPDALVIRIPAGPAGGESRQALLRAQGRVSAPAVRTFGLASPPELEQRGATAEVRFRLGPAPAWIAFEPRDGSRALELESRGLPPLSAPGGARLAPGSYRWLQLRWGAAAALPGQAALFTTPPAPRSATASAHVSSELASRLLALGYLQGAPALAPSLEPAPASASPAPPFLPPGVVRILRAD
ncbi:MAG: sulfatase [Acidobacteriota bacterium]